MTGRRVPPRDPSALAREAARVTQDATWGVGVAVAAELSLIQGHSISSRSVHNWGEPQSERPGPFLRAAELLLALLAAHDDPDVARGPLYWLNELAGLEANPRLDSAGADALQTVLLRLAGQFGRLLDHVEDAFQDNRFDWGELTKGKREIRRLRERLAALEEIMHLHASREAG